MQQRHKNKISPRIVLFQENDQRKEHEKKMEARRLQKEAELQRKATGKYFSTGVILYFDPPKK